MSAAEVTVARSRAPVARADLRLGLPGMAAWAGAFVATSGHLAQRWSIGSLLLIAVAMGVACRHRQWAVVACLLGLFAGLGMGAVRFAALHVDVVDQFAHQRAKGRGT